MAGTTGIEWADATLNVAWGCTKVSQGCDKCYVDRLSNMFGKSFFPTPKTERNVKKAIAVLGQTPKIVFLNSMSDTFHEEYSDGQILEWFKLIAATPHHYIILTKRIARALTFTRKYTVAGSNAIPANCSIGTSIENRGAYHRLRTLKKINQPGVLKFVSLEPLLASVADINIADIDWVIVGGESDYIAPRPFDEQWAREIRGRCTALNIPFFYKQSGGSSKNKEGTWGTNYLDGRQHMESPDFTFLDQQTKIPKEQTTLIGFNTEGMRDDAVADNDARTDYP